MKEVIYFKESLLQSFISDLISMYLLMSAIWFNYRYCGNNFAISTLLIIMAFVVICNRSTGMAKVFTNKKALLDYLFSKDGADNIIHGTHDNSSKNFSIKTIPQQLQRQDNLDTQLRDIIVAGNRLGLYDAVNYIQQYVSKKLGGDNK